ncbi:6-hydroxymethylpterin diphosphokinase MptE-like protein [Sulfurimonas sp.]|uniref:6-hydroxymethylpterin diphosphokinase MptE-like protein n=1 Tax=Sulfurimonas sp. TaxID=2022749 RepID=UPI003D100775
MSTLKKLLEKNILLTPYNDLSKQFAKNLRAIGCNKITYIDAYKDDENCLKPNQIKNLDFDYIVILSPNYYLEIYTNLLNYTRSSKIGFAHTHINLLKSQKSFITFNKFFYKLYLIYLNFYIKYGQQFFFLGYKNFLDLRRYRNKYIQQTTRAFIIGNGPSLTVNDLNLLKNEITFAANKIYLAFSETQWRPTYYFVIDNLVYKQNHHHIEKLNLIKFFSIDMLYENPQIENALYFNIARGSSTTPLPVFNTNPFTGIAKGNTVVYAMAQMAVYMGIKELYFIGMDFNFQLPEKSDLEVSRVLTCEGESNHFHKDYRKEGEKWNAPNMEGLTNAFLKLKEYGEKNNIKICNATRGGKLEILPRVNLDELLQKH